jgi:prepilin-type N-terminal cleavage/methylation domain-containing protein
MFNSKPSRGFTIVELLVVVSIIALLVGILLPAIGKAREQAQLTRSQANLKQLGTAAATYQAEFRDRQLTFCNDNLQQYSPGGDGPTAVTNYFQQNGYEHPGVILGLEGGGTIWGYWCPGSAGGSAAAGNYIVPLEWTSKFGAFRMLQARQFSRYLNGRFYDPVYYAPKDIAVSASVETLMEHPGEFVNSGTIKWSSYIYSPAAMFNPDVLSKDKSTGKFYKNPWDLAAGFRSPSASQAAFPDLKTQIIEHHWLQGPRRKMCNAIFTGGPYDGCQPYFFNGSIESTPMCLFFDGHIAGLPVLQAVDAQFRLHNQAAGGTSGSSRAGTWSVDTPLGGEYIDNAPGGYYQGQQTGGYDWAATSFHILTRDGIKGRDTLPAGQ